MRSQSRFFFISWAMIFGICIDYRSAESIGVRIVLYLKRQYVASVGSTHPVDLKTRKRAGTSCQIEHPFFD